MFLGLFPDLFQAISVNSVSLNLQGKDDVYDRMLLDYFFSYHQFIHLLCRVAINCEKFTETLVKMSEYMEMKLYGLV